jgi:AcrR family transcriptional regulator
MSIATPAPLASRRKERSRLAILDAALALCAEQGYGSLTIEAIAARAGVGKQTIYRWWPSKGAVLLEALCRESAANVPTPDTGDIVADVRAIVSDVTRLFTQPEFGPQLAALICEAQRDPVIGPALLERFIRPRRAPIVERLRVAQQQGKLPASLDPDVVLEIIFGALYHRLLLRNGPLDSAYASFVVDIVFSGCSNPATSHAPQMS